MESLLIFKALADDSRIKILTALSSQSCSPLTLSEQLKMIPTTVSFHIGKLLEAGLIQASKEKSGTYLSNLETLNLSLFQILNLNTIPEKIISDNSEIDYRKQVIKNFFKDGLLLSLPDQKRKRNLVLQIISQRLTPERMHTEQEFNDFLKKIFAAYEPIKNELLELRLVKITNGLYHRA
ncbi:MAG: ArsR family transcriptional regulator [Pseudobdellovibrio sp.]